MANSPSALKRAHQAETRRKANSKIRSEVRTRIKRINQLIEAGDLDVARAQFPSAQSHAARAARKRIFNANTVSRMIAQLNRKLKVATQNAAAASASSAEASS